LPSTEKPTSKRSHRAYGLNATSRCLSYSSRYRTPTTVLLKGQHPKKTGSSQSRILSPSDSRVGITSLDTLRGT